MESHKVTYAEHEVCSDEEAGNERVKAERAGLLLKQSKMPLEGKKGGVFQHAKVKRGEQLIVSDV